MRVLWLTNDLPPRSGGIQQFVQNLLVRSWPDETLVIGPAEDGAATHDAAQPYAVRRASGSVHPTPSVLRLVREAAAEHRPDVLVLGASWPLGELGRWLARDPGVPIVALSHGLEAGIAGAGLGALVGRSTRHLAALTTITEFTADQLRPHVRAGRMVPLPPGVDPDAFHPGIDATALRRSWGVPAGAPLVGCVSRLVRRKGQDRLLEAWPAIVEAHPEAWLAVVGTGPLEASLRSQAADLTNVVITGEVAWRDLPAAYAALDLFVMPCRTRLGGTDVEGLGIVYLEAQACGVPAIAGRSGGAPEAVREGETGLVVDGDDPDEIARAVGELLGDPARRAAMGERGRAWIERTWAWDAIAARFRDLLTEVTS